MNDVCDPCREQLRACVENLMRRSRACALQAHQVSAEELARRFRNYEVALGELLRVLDGKEPAILTEATENRRLFATMGQNAADVKQVMAGWHPAPQQAPALTREQEPDDGIPF